MYKIDDAVWRLGLPDGSLNNPGRGYTLVYIRDAGYKISGYEPGKELHPGIANDEKIACTITRPSAAPAEMLMEVIDATIIGEDWAVEYNWGKDWEGNPSGETLIEKIGDLGYGGVRLVAAIPKELKEKGITSVNDLLAHHRDQGHFERGNRLFLASEYKNLAKKFLMEQPVYQDLFGDTTPDIRGRTDFFPGSNPLVFIYQTDGVTESYCDKGFDFIIDNTQTGSALRAYGLEEIDELMTSTAGLYVGPTCTGWKREKAEEFYQAVNGAVIAADYVVVSFNIPLNDMDSIARKLIKFDLCSQEPTFSKPAPGIEREVDFASGTILIARDDYPKARKTLTDTGATWIYMRRPDQVVINMRRPDQVIR